MCLFILDPYLIYLLTHVQGLVKLADFGVASRLGEIADEEDPAAIAVVGTPYWMAPEVGGNYSVNCNASGCRKANPVMLVRPKARTMLPR